MFLIKLDDMMLVKRILVLPKYDAYMAENYEICHNSQLSEYHILNIFMQRIIELLMMAKYFKIEEQESCNNRLHLGAVSYRHIEEGGTFYLN